MTDRSAISEVLRPWKVLIADDDADVHTTTRMALRGTEFRGRSLEFIDAYSGAETLTALEAHPDIALVFLDIIMESDDAGLVAAKRIREEGFTLVRIIFRTGFPGQTPERKVIIDYDIHDYKEKTGLSVQKLYTAVISALRSYDDLAALESHRRGLRGVLESVSWFDFNAIQRYVSGMLAEFSNLVGLGSDRIVMLSRPSSNPSAEAKVLVSSGDVRGLSELVLMQNLSSEGADLIRETFDCQQGLAATAGKTIFARSHGVDLVVFAIEKNVLLQADEVLLEVFLIKVCQAVSNQQTFADMASERDSVLCGLARRAEAWNDQGAQELNSLGALACALAKRLHTTLSFSDEIDERFRRDIAVAAMLHDFGNETLPAELLQKPATYLLKERQQMQAHVAAGLAALAPYLTADCNPGVLTLARDIIASHHEHYDGTGYPKGLKGEKIPLVARLVAVADSYTAMISPRPYRPAMSAVAARAMIKAGAGAQYDPDIVRAFFELDEALFAKLSNWELLS